MADTLVRDLMTEIVFAAAPEDNLTTVYNLMAEHQVRHVPVLDSGGALVGIVTHRDLLRHRLIEQQDLPNYVIREVRSQCNVAQVMTAAVATVESETDIRAAAQTMYQCKYGCLPVVEDGKLTGILTEADFVRYFTEHGVDATRRG